MDKQYFIHCFSKVLDNKLPSIDMPDNRWLEETQSVIAHILGGLYAKRNECQDRKDTKEI